MKQALLLCRFVFGAWMLINGANYLFFSFWPMPIGHEPLAIQLMAALVHSRLMNVAMTLQLVTGALILAGFFVPVALCVVMPISTCALYWAVVLDHQPLDSLAAIAAFALNGVLMLAHVDYYKGVLQRRALALFESSGAGRNFDSLFVNPRGRTSRGQFVGGLVVVIAVLAFYAYSVTGLTAHWCMLMVVFSAVMLHARRLHDMGRSAWPLLVPAVLSLGAFAVWLRLASFGAQADAALPGAALFVSAGFALWGSLGKGQAETNRFGAPVAL
jgi:uncharacterized membrane protein YhaH (DUF805 family)